MLYEINLPMVVLPDGTVCKDIDDYLINGLPIPSPELISRPRDTMGELPKPRRLKLP